ncbi:MAG: hypothetical protein AAB492_02325, partial [Patescibacteria group bacterium]
MKTRNNEFFLYVWAKHCLLRFCVRTGCLLCSKKGWLCFSSALLTLSRQIARGDAREPWAALC